MGPVALPFTLNFFGNSYGSLYVNNNGNVTFDQGMSTYTPFGLQSAGRPIIAPYFGDVWTEGTPAVTYGVDTVDGHQAFGVNWFDVGYFAATDKRNTFQLVLIDRSDRGPGDFDIEFNYSQIQWETGNASGGFGGLGGDSAHVGYSNGTTTSFELPGSGVPGTFLDTGTNPLIDQSRNTFQPGRLLFPVENGAAPTGGTISGNVYANSVAPANALAGAFLQACGSGGNCLTSSTNASGFYQFTGLPGGTYTITAFPPSNSALLQASVGNLAISGGNTIGGQNIILTGPQPLPNGTTITNRGVGSNGIPIIYWQSPETLTTTGCAGGAASYQVVLAAGSTNPGAVIASGSMTEWPAGSGTYTASFPAVYPNHGNATVRMTINCPNAGATTTTFNIYIDPSGKVVDQNNNPIPGATVTLYRSDTANGTFSVVPNGSGIMSVANRNNPDTTDANGLFGWDVVAGYYQVRASAPGCVDPNNGANAYVTSAVLQIPPAVTNVTLQLNCPDIIPPTTQATLSPAPNAAGWNNGPVAVTLNATDNQGGSGVRSITYSATGAQPIANATANGATVTLPTVTAEGVTTLSFAATDNANNTEATNTLPIRIDTAPPTCNITVVAGPPKQAIAAVQDGGSGLASIQVTEANNATYAIAPFSAGTTQPVTVTFTKVDQSLGAQFALVATDQAGNSVACDPADVTVDRATGKPVPTTVTGIQGYERTVTIQNGTPGLTELDVAVNGKHFKVARPAEGATTTLDIGSALQPGNNNTVTLTPKGKPGGSATVLIWGDSSSTAKGSAVVAGTRHYKKPAPNTNAPTEIDRHGAPVGKKAK